MPASQRRVEADEHVLRRVFPEHWAGEETSAPSPYGFKPAGDDADGLTVWLASKKSPESLHGRKREREFYVASLRVGDIRDRGLEVILTDESDGHCVIPQITAAEYASSEDSTLEFMVALSESISERLGPFRLGSEPSPESPQLRS